MGEDLLPHDEQVAIVLADEHLAGPADSSIRVPGDLSLSKPACDVLLLGRAYAPRGRPATEMDVSVTVGPVSKTVRVIGDRHWESTGVGYAPSSPLPFERMPLLWEKAFGGTDRCGDELRAEARNMAGTGYRAPDGEKELDGLPLPNLEDPENLISSWKQTPPPSCFAPVSPHWEPRRSYAGTYDEVWQRERAPYLPLDFDSRFFQLAPPGLVAPGYLRGDEPVAIRGATPDGLLRFELPGVRLSVTHFVDSTSETQLANLDTILIEPDQNRVILVWRAAYECAGGALRVKEVRVSQDEVA
ncbi:MAG: DUF2169 domain-containing protein [Gemmatimonadota bacterium]|nr:MAG: DUF2169 domain-containing protein [Gemmatimonadota bacterium]